VNILELDKMVGQHRLDPNYQFKGQSTDAMAGVSWSRLTEERQKLVLAACLKLGITDIELVIRARFLAQTNLFFLCKLLGYKDFSAEQYLWKDGTVHNTHEEICNDFFVRKDPTKLTFKKFADEYNSAVDKKERLLLVPRGGFKSTMNMCDCVQWVISYPEVTMLVLSGVLSLANSFVSQIKKHFTLEETNDPEWITILGLKRSYRPRMLDDGTPFVFQALFAEHCIPEDDGRANVFQTRASAATTSPEPTLFSASIEQSLTGFHVCVLKLDDVVTNENSQTVERLKNVNKQISINQAMLHPYGFYDKIGTWYDSEDTYGQDIKNARKYEEDGESFPMKIYVRPAWWPTEEAIKLGKIEEEMVASDYHLWFNQSGQLTYEFLRNKKKTDPYFAIKYLNDPTQMHVIKFPRELLVRKTIPAIEVPGTGMIVTCVDTAYSTKTWADFTVIVTALIYGGRFFVIDMKRGRYDEYTLPAMIAATAAQWKPKQICIEESGAIKYIAREVYREMDKLKVRVPIRLVPLGQGSKKNSKNVKAGPVLRFLGDDRLKFVNTCPQLEDLYDELSKFGTAASLHDDIVDALAIMVNEFSSYADIEAKLTAAQESYSPDSQGKKFYQQVFDGKGVRNDLPLEFPDQAPGEMERQASQDASYMANDPLNDLFS
jgi:phage terminase large subunit-like protein